MISFVGLSGQLGQRQVHLRQRRFASKKRETDRRLLIRVAESAESDASEAGTPRVRDGRVALILATSSHGTLHVSTY